MCPPLSIPRSPRRGRRVGKLALLALALAAAGCSPVYVVKAGIAEARILRNRRPLAEVILDPATDPRTRGTLTFVMEAREFARDELHLDVGGSYTSFTQLESDTLAMVLSAAYRDRLAPKTWWFPVVGHVPYRGFFDLGDAQRAQRELEAEGYDTYLRPTSAFSTLGWFDDPLVSSILRADDVDVVETVLHELSHNHLFVPGRVRFNESYATFVGRAGAAEFFCTRPGGGPDTVKCQRAQARWRDVQRFSRFLQSFVAELETLYGRGDLAPDEVLHRREGLFRQAQARFTAQVAPELESLTFRYFVDTPLNNATLLARVRYYHRLADFATLAEREGGVAGAVAFLARGVKTVDDPFELLPSTGSDGR